MSARKLTWAGMFVALTLVADQLPPGASSGTFGNIFRIIGFPVVLSGLVLGPAGGFLVGAVSDVLCFLIGPPSLPFFPGFTLTQGLTGALPPLLFGLMQSLRPRAERGSLEGPWVLPQLIVAVTVTKLICSVVLVSYFRSLLSGKQTFLVFAGPALLVCLIHSPLYAWLSLPLMRSLRRVQDRQ